MPADNTPLGWGARYIILVAEVGSLVLGKSLLSNRIKKKNVSVFNMASRDVDQEIPVIQVEIRVLDRRRV